VAIAIYVVRYCVDKLEIQSPTFEHCEDAFEEMIAFQMVPFYVFINEHERVRAKLAHVKIPITISPLHVCHYFVIISSASPPVVKSFNGSFGKLT